MCGAQRNKILGIVIFSAIYMMNINRKTFWAHRALKWIYQKTSSSVVIRISFPIAIIFSGTKVGI
jgi:hypothetical protein